MEIKGLNGVPFCIAEGLWIIHNKIKKHMPGSILLDGVVLGKNIFLGIKRPESVRNIL
jgi:hypothetical protein